MPRKKHRWTFKGYDETGVPIYQSNYSTTELNKYKIKAPKRRKSSFW